MNLQLIDTHCHLYGQDFSKDIRAVIERAENEGVRRFYLPAIDSEVIDAMLQLEQDFPGKCFAMMGLHPCSVKEDHKQELALVEQWLAKRPFKAVGEIGLDYYWDKTFIDAQKEAFHQQIEWALHYQLPIVIHSRESMADSIEIVRQHQKGNLGGIFHCFTGTLEEAQQIIDLGFYLGIGGVVTYKNTHLREVLKAVSMDHIVLETDAPYLTPVPFRGKRNESSYLKYIVEKVAEVKEIPVSEAAAITTANAKKIFGA
ncbi:hydrolase TatD [Niastella vici]|uniref:Hydrolase TatD n=1 Tax=Niastella vici TaxID=1703345 RepID=A0A1V9G2S0_9BACT|nr:TatD family hydrolase [Niastella vici]OQP64854.1 hydrolase TatD [Niastella vici]